MADTPQKATAVTDYHREVALTALAQIGGLQFQGLRAYAVADMLARWLADGTMPTPQQIAALPGGQQDGGGKK